MTPCVSYVDTLSQSGSGLILLLSCTMSRSVSGLVLLLSCLSLCQGSIITLQLSPTAIQPPLTPTVELRCNVNDTHVSGAIVGRSVTSAVDVHFVTSLMVKRDGQDIASVGEHIPARAFGDVTNLQVTGKVMATPGERGYIHLTWTYPTNTQEGEYTCDVTGIDGAGHHILLSTSAELTTSSPSIDVLAEHIKNLTVESVSQRSMIEDLQIDARTKSNQLASMSEELAKAQHIEHGQVMCGTSESWAAVDSHHVVCTVSHLFSRSYDKSPIVFLGGAVDYWEYFSTTDGWMDGQVTISLANVDKQGFNVTMKTYKFIATHDKYGLGRLAVNWISFYDF